jgi:single-strand DNA-binding protein
MARSRNKVFLLGNLGSDPEKKTTPSGRSVTRVSLATSDTWKDKQTGEQKERTEWHTVVFFDRLADIVAEYCRKGSKLDVEGKIQTRKWQDKDGKDRYTTEIIGSEVIFGDSGHNGSSSGDRYQDSRSAAANDRDDFEDEIPF